MRFDIITLFPEFFASPLSSGLMAKALARGIAEVVLTNPRKFSTDKHQRVDDEPYGGGVGMVMKPEPLFAAVESLPCLPRREVIYVTPQGEPLTQQHLWHWSQERDQLVILCGHYEGVDERVVEHLVTQESPLVTLFLPVVKFPPLSFSMACCDSCQAQWAKLPPSTKRALKTACWTIPTTLDLRNFEVGQCRRSCFPVTTGKLRRGDGRNKLNALANDDLICMPNG